MSALANPDDRRTASRLSRYHATIAAVCIAMPVIFLICYLVLGRAFGYPAVTDAPGADVLVAYRPNAAVIGAAFYVIAMTELLRIAIAVGLHGMIGTTRTPWLAVFTVFGIVAGLVRMLDYLLWPFLVPRLAEIAADPVGGELAGHLFRSLFSYLGDALGGNVGILLLVVWIWGLSAAIWATRRLPRWLAVFGAVAGLLVGLNYIEFLGSTSGVIGILGILGQAAQNFWFMLLGITILWVGPGDEA